MNKVQILCFALGWQGGDIHHVAMELGITPHVIEAADDKEIEALCRKAIIQQWEKRKDILVQLGVCIEHLEADYKGHVEPAWLKKAREVFTESADREYSAIILKPAC